MDERIKRIRFVTLGCKVNQYETQAMREQVVGSGMAREVGGPSDIIVLNTCTVTKAADRENRYWIRRLRRENPEAKIVVTGCWVERNRTAIEELPEVDLVLSNHQKPDLAQRLMEGCATPDVQQAAGPIRFRSKADYAPLGISSFQGHARAFLKIQDGCNHACSFCKVVLVRGSSRSRALTEIVEEAQRLADAGYREVVLTGIQLGAYGLDLHPPLNLIAVLESLSRVPGIERIRLSSIEPTDVKEDLIRCLKALPRLCPQLHIPLQSGDDEILKRMNRRYGREFYLELADSLRREIPDFSLSMDVMVGFPTEEESQFQNTLEVIEKTRPIRIHAFPYSPREGTRAARFKEVAPEVVRERMNRLFNFSNRITRLEKAKFLGRILPVLVEKAVPGTGLLQGHTVNYLKVGFTGPSDWVGASVRVHLLEIRGDDPWGKAEEEPGVESL